MQYNDIKNNILDTGAGIAQSMPVIITAAMKYLNDDTLLNIFEEPETHLHPAAHAEMLEFIAKNIKSSNNKKLALIETHSLNFILRLRLMVAEKFLSTDDVALYYVDFDKEEGSSSLKEVEINSDGSVSKWPENIFNESLGEILKIRTTQMQQK